MNTLSRLRFDALAGYTRSPYLRLTAQELGWFEEGNEKVLGIVSLDLPDQDYLWTALGRDAQGRFRAIDLEINIPTQEEATARLTAKLAHYAQQPPASFFQGDETGKPIDFFSPVVPQNKQHPVFNTLITQPGYSSAQELLAQLMPYFEDPDGNFVQQFQSTGCDARLWELYLYALFTELEYGFDRELAALDFHCEGLRGDFFVEATTVNPSDTTPIVDAATEQAYFEHYVPIKFGSALYSKLKKKYWELPHVADRPLMLAIQDFHAPRSMAWSNTALQEYLYGLRQSEKKLADGTSELVSERIAKYVWQGKEIPAGFFFQPDAEYISAVIANPSGTISKFTRMGFLAGFGRRDIKMFRRGVCYRDSVIPEQFIAEVTAAGYTETWCEGLSVYHNPQARIPLPETAIPGAAHHILRDGKILTSMPSFFPVGSITQIIVPTDDPE